MASWIDLESGVSRDNRPTGITGSNELRKQFSIKRLNEMEIYPGEPFQKS